MQNEGVIGNNVGTGVVSNPNANPVNAQANEMDDFEKRMAALQNM